MRKPVGTTSASDAQLQGSRWRARARTETCFDSPSTRRSNMTTEPTRMAKPTMWIVSTMG